MIADKAVTFQDNLYAKPSTSTYFGSLSVEHDERRSQQRSIAGIIAWPAGGKTKTGQILDYLGKPNRKMCSLYLSLMDKMGLKLPEFGDATERLSDV